MIASTNVVSFVTLVMISKGSFWGAAAGRPPTPTDTARVMTEDMILTSPTQPIHEIRSRVWMEENPKSSIAPTTTNTTVQVPCSEMAFKATENERRPAPAMATCSSYDVSDGTE